MSHNKESLVSISKNKLEEILRLIKEDCRALKKDGVFVNAPTLTQRKMRQIIRAKFLRGTISDFDALLQQTFGFTKETAEEVRDLWIDLELLAFDKKMLLVWWKK